MFRLAREVRFAINEQATSGKPVNGYGGWPAAMGLDPFFRLQITVSGPLDEQTQCVVDIKQIDAVVRRVGIPLVRKYVRTKPRAAGGLMIELFENLKSVWPAKVQLESLVLAISRSSLYQYAPSEVPMIRLNQKFEFSASHRLYNPALSDQQNRAMFGKCSNPHGHGHNYELQVTLLGSAAADGELIDMPEFEGVVDETIIDRFDHKNLNVELPEFATVIPSVENIAKAIYFLLKPKMNLRSARLAAVTVWETPKTSCEFSEMEK